MLLSSHREMCPCWKEHNTVSSHNSGHLAWAESPVDPRVPHVPYFMLFTDFPISHHAVWLLDRSVLLQQLAIRALEAEAHAEDAEWIHYKGD